MAQAVRTFLSIALYFLLHLFFLLLFMTDGDSVTMNTLCNSANGTFVPGEHFPREYTLPRDDPASEAKGWIQGNTRIGPILEVTTSFQHFKFGVEVRIQSVNEDNSQSWVGISYGTVRYVNNYIKYNTQSLASPQEEEAEPASSEVIAARSKAKAKPQPRESSGTTTIPFNERIWIDIVPSKQDFDSHILSKRVINLLRHNQKLHREQDGAVQFYKNQIPSERLSSSNTKLV